MAKRQNFVVGSTNPNTNTWTSSELNNGWDKYQVLKSGDLDGVFKAVSDYSNDSSQEIANAIQALTGTQPTGASQNELAGALQQMREDIETSSLTFKGYVATSAPSSSTYGLVEGNIWINASTMPTTFPVAIAGVWNGTSWESTTDTYTVKDFDFFRNINNNEGYYWFGGQWTIMSTDMSTTYFTLNQTSGKWEIKSSVNLPGNPTTTTPTSSSPDDQIATKKYVDEAIAPLPTTTYFPDLFDHKWADHILDDAQWLRADTFSWQSGTVYQAAYAHLVLDIDGKTLQSETISGTTIQFYLADDGHKICPASQESNVTAIYNATGVAWYYIIDTTNTRFKLPRTQFAFTGIRSSVGKFVSAGLPNITASWENRGASASASGAVNVTTRSWGNRDASDGQNSGAYTLDASRSSSIYGNSTTVQPKATEMYLYFYVGNFTQTALENTAGLNTELFNGKAGIDLDNLSSAGQAVVAHMAMPSNRYIDLTLGDSGSTYTAPADGYIFLNKSATGSNQTISIINDSNGMRAIDSAPSSSSWVATYLPVSKGQSIRITYTAGGTTNAFRFIYANGAQ